MTISRTLSIPGTRERRATGLDLGWTTNIYLYLELFSLRLPMGAHVEVYSQVQRECCQSRKRESTSDCGRQHGRIQGRGVLAQTPFIYIIYTYMNACMCMHILYSQNRDRFTTISRLLGVLLTLLTPLDSRQSKKKAFVLHHDRIYVVILRVKSSPEMNYYYKSQKLRENTTKLNAKTPQIC